jgi:hypothetical protein
MDEPIVPATPEQLAARLLELRYARRRRNREPRAPTRRQSLNPRQRAEVLAKTAGRCHICGGAVEVRWEADHVLSHSDGGAHAVDNYLAAHRLCNNYRWDYSSEEFQWVLKIGVWVRHQMEVDNTQFGSEMLRRFFGYETHRESRRRKKPQDSE